MLRKIILNGRGVTYWEAGPESAQPIVLVHGFRGSHLGLQRLGEQFADYRIIIPDLPGQGETEALKAIHNIRHYTKWLDDFANELNLKKFLLLGHSYGSLLCLEYARRHRYKLAAPLLLVSPIPPPTALVWLFGQYYRAGRVLPASWQKHWLYVAPVNRIGRRLLIRAHDPKLVKTIMAEGESEPLQNNPRANIEELTSMFSLPLRRLIHRLDLPTYVCTGNRDQVAPFRAVLKYYGANPHIHINVIDGMGHLGPEEVPEVIAAEFLPRLPSARI
jgi:pimeloyl-ACP methyl ester carboxylesterase